MSPPEAQVIRGISAALGVVAGPAFLLERERISVPQHRLEQDQVEREVERLRVALEESYEQLDSLRAKLDPEHSETGLILEAQAALMRDPQMVDEPARLIREHGINAEWALARALEAIRVLFRNAEDAYLRERSQDIDHAGARVLRNLTGIGLFDVTPPPGSVVVARMVSPADVVQLHRAGVAGLALDVGGRTSHSSILARAFEMPAVVGLRDVSGRVATGDWVIVDGLAGDVVLAPTPEQRARYERRAVRFAAQEKELLKNRELPAVTTDGYAVGLLANIELVEEVDLALAHGAEGVGLYRTEFMYMEREQLPTEEDHHAEARAVLEAVGDRPVTFRTFDLGGGDKTSGLLALPEQANPALGLRSLRLAFREEAVFRTQLRGLLRASPAGTLKIMFPMVSGVDELRHAKELLQRCRDELAREGHPVAERIAVGMMLEMPSTVIIADTLARECDFFSIGTNDLIQYTLAIDRGNEHVNYLYHPLHPAILRIIRYIVRVAHAEGIPVGLCGDMAGDPLLTLVLLGLGLDQLSMTAESIPRIKRIVRGCSSREAVDLTERLVRMPTVREIEATVYEVMCPRFLEAPDAVPRTDASPPAGSRSYPVAAGKESLPGARRPVPDFGVDD